MKDVDTIKKETLVVLQNYGPIHKALWEEKLHRIP
jgi:hypothetical protein